MSLKIVLSIVLLLMISLVISTVMLAAHNNREIIQQLKTSALPQDIKQDFKAGRLPRHWLYVRPTAKHIKYISNNTPNNRFWQQRETAILKTLQELMPKLPKADLLFCIEDGVNKAYARPLLAFAARKDLVQSKAVVLIPDFEALRGYEPLLQKIDIAKTEFPWQQKHNKIFWRGTPNGGNQGSFKIAGIARLELLQLGQHLDFVDAGITSFKADLDRYFVAELQKIFPLQPVVTPQASLAFKYLIDVDGHSCSYSRMAWILYSNSLLMKHQTDNVQWYYGLLQPYKHYLPIKPDFSDLQAQFEWAQKHPHEVQKIIADAQVLALQIFTNDKIKQAFLNGLQQYAKLSQN